MIISLVLILISLFGAAFFAGSETAFVALLRRKGRIEGLSKSVFWWLDNPDELLSVTLIGTNICIIIASSVSAALFIKFFGDLGELYSLIVISLVGLVFCEVLPKSRALTSPTSFAKLVITPLNLSGKILKPLSKVTNALSSMVVRVVHRVIKPAPVPSWKEFETVTAKGDLKLDISSKTMMLLMFEVASKTAFDIMEPRSSLPIITVDVSISEARRRAQKMDVGNLIVESDAGRIIGFVEVVDLFAEDEREIRGVLREPFFVPENAPVLKVFMEMDDSDVPFALVVDEHGNVTGGISREALVNLFMGIGSTAHLRGRTPSGYIVEGVMTIDQIETLLEYKFPRGPYKTVAGFIEELLNKIPEEGTTLNWEKWAFTIEKRSAKAILRIRIEPREER